LTRHLFFFVVFLFSSWCGIAQAGGRLLATGGVTEIEGAAGGGIVSWALIAGSVRLRLGGSGAVFLNDSLALGVE
jgi:hypothetical protein